MEEDEELRVVKRRGGTHRSNSLGTPGYERDLLRDDGSNEVRGPTESRAPTDGDLHEVLGYEPYLVDNQPDNPLSKSQQFAADVLSQVVTDLVASIDWAALARKGIGELRKRLRPSERRAHTRRTAGPEIANTVADPAVAADHSGAEVVERGLTMTVAEYRERALSALAAEAYAKRQREVLASSHVEGEDLTPEVAAAVRLMLEGRAASVDEVAMAAVVEFFERQPNEPQQLRRAESRELAPIPPNR